jgi:cytochrome c553
MKRLLMMLKAWRGQGLTVRPELVEGWAVNPFMVRRPTEVPVGQAHHERLNLKLSGLLSCGILLVLSGQTAHATNLYAGQSRAAAVCSQCHGIRTPSADAPFPTLAGRDAEYLQTALKQYRDKTRKSDIMNAIAGSLTDEDIANVVAYYAKLKP